MHRTPRRHTHRAAALVVALAVGLASALATTSTPAAAAPPPATHPGVVNPDPIDHTPHVLDGRTEAVLDLGDRVIVGGTFTSVKRWNRPETFNRSRLFAYDKATGEIDTRFAPQPDGRVMALLRGPDGGVLVAGQFRNIGGRPISYLAKLDPVTGAVDPSYNPSPWGMVFDLHLANGNLYVAGAFTRVDNIVRTNFAILDARTGAVRPGPDIAFGTAPAGATRVMRIDVTPDGRKLVAIGNFATVGGQARPNVAVLDLSGSSATVSSWRTDQFRYRVCGGSWDTITYDADISPDGRYFVIVTTGGPGGTSRLCDTATRWETSATGVASPTWTNFSGGDTLTSVAVTGAAVYVAGHMRWMDNPHGRDSAGPGAVDRQGIAALDPATGRTLSWNPGRERGLIAPRLVATPEGLYVLSDSSRFAGEWHPRLTYLTLTGRLPDTPGPGGPATPSAPGMPTVTAVSPTSVTLSWQAPGVVGSSAVSGHRIIVRADAGGTVVATHDVGAGRTATVGGLAPGRLYRFSVTARNGSGLGTESERSDWAVPPFRNIDFFTERQFRDIAGRQATALDLVTWRNRLTAGQTTPVALVDGLLGQAHRVRTKGSIARLYRAYFLRMPDTAGLDYWVGRADRGLSLQATSQHFSGSPEFVARYGRLSDADFVRLVYRNVLGRQPDAAGLSYWTGRLRSGGTRGWVMTGFSESAEYVAASRGITDLVTTIHSMLGRAPTASEAQAWEGRVRSGQRAALVTDVLGRPAYAARL